MATGTLLVGVFPGCCMPTLFSRLSDARMRERIANGIEDSEMPAFAGSLEAIVKDLDTPYGLDFLPDGRLLVSEGQWLRLTPLQWQQVDMRFQ